MSVKVTSWVWEHSQARGPARLVLLAIADNAHDDGAQAWPSMTTLTRKTGLAERTVQIALNTLQKLGELEVDHNAGPRHCNLYRVLMPPPAPDAPPHDMHPARPAGVQEMHPTPAGDAPPPPQEMHPEPSVEPSRNRRPSPTARVASATPATITAVAVIPTAQTYVAAYIDAYRGRAGHDPPSRVKGQVAKHLREAFTDGVSADHIKAGLVEWFDANQHPATLPSFIEVAGRNGQPRASPTRAARQIDQARRTYEEMMANASGGVGADGGPPQSELARPADHHPDR